MHPPTAVRRSTGWDPWSAVPWELCCMTSCCSPVCAACLRGSPRWRAPGLRRPRASRRPGESPLSSRHRPYKPAEEVKLADPPPAPLTRTRTSSPTGPQDTDGGSEEGLPLEKAPCSLWCWESVSPGRPGGLNCSGQGPLSFALSPPVFSLSIFLLVL